MTSPRKQARSRGRGGGVVMALERCPRTRRDGGGARMRVKKIQEIQKAVTIPVMAKARIGHVVAGADPGIARRRLHRRVRGADAADEHFHIDKFAFGSRSVRLRDLGEARGASARARR